LGTTGRGCQRSLKCLGFIAFEKDIYELDS